ncbi:ATP/GTP-binding protein [Streptomyces sp. CB02488]|uniref:ATP/GTP-binding protein n=1 Tax=Streptomyces sp. CB02488 TaxID=1703920 RepID=UPI00093D68DC|nr:ATP/GTP-binding protein [Streptomyces sp. CB02488]OKK09166.1 ATP/GTP-binding protein [Streptomyces sp. CB02488]
MDNEGTHGARGTRGAQPPDGRPGGSVPHPAGPPPARPPGPPPMAPPVFPPAVPTPSEPTGAPRGGPSIAEWLNTARPVVGPGVWRYAYAPRPAEKPPRQSPLGRVLTLVLAVLAVAQITEYRIPYLTVPFRYFTPQEWYTAGSQLRPGVAPNIAYALQTLYIQAVALLLVLWAAKLGSWAGLFRHYAGENLARARLTATGLGAVIALWIVWNGSVPLLEVVFLALPRSLLRADGSAFIVTLVAYGVYALVAAVVVWPFARTGGWHAAVGGVRQRRADARVRPPAEPVLEDLARWPELRAAGLPEAAEVLTGAVRAERMNDVDCARLGQAWERARFSPDRIAAFTAETVRKGPDAFLHPSGSRDLPLRSARHDLLTDQVRIGFCVDNERNPYPRRGSGVALEPSVLGTSLLAVGPSGAGKTTRLVRPVVETLALQALAGKTAVLAVGAAGASLGPDEAFDVVVKVGDPSSLHDFDLYGSTTDPDEAAATLAEGLVGDVPDLDSRRAALVLGQLLGPYRTVHGHFPSVPELRELLAGSESALAGLRQALEEGGHHAMLRELDARVRHTGSSGDPATVLAERIGLLDRPAFAGFFATGADARPFTLRSLEQHPVRVRIDLPERVHAGASRVLTRLILAQFNSIAAARTERSRFACLVLDDATGTITPGTVRGLRHLRSVNAGAVLALRTVDDVPEGLHSALLGAMGCGMIFSGVTTWDGKRFSEAWGKEWVTVREVAKHTVFADQPVTRALHTLRKLATGNAVTTDAVTVRQVERERWSASQLAYELPAGHAVLSLTTVDGEHAPPVLVQLGG